MQALKQFGIAVGLSMVSQLAYSALLTPAYEAVIPIDREHSVAESELLREALGEVLVHATANPDISAHPQVISILSRPKRYASQYQNDGDFFKVSFDTFKVNLALDNAKIPHWSGAKPQVIAWMGLDDGGQKTLVNADTFPSIPKQMEWQADAIGLPLMFPLLDLEDVSKVSVRDILTDFPSGLADASERYGADAMLVVRINQLTDADADIHWQSKWQLISGDYDERWDIDGAELNTQLKEGILQAARLLVSQPVKSDFVGSGERLRIEVSTINSIEDYARVMAHLSALPPVSQVTLKSVSPQGFQFELLPKSDANLNSVRLAVADSPIRVVALHDQGQP